MEIGVEEQVVDGLRKLEERLKKCHRLDSRVKLLHDEETISEEEITAVTAARLILEEM